MRGRLLTFLLLCVTASASAQPYSTLGLPPSISKPLLQKLLQQFVTVAYGKGFRHLGDERDFDHGHLLFAADGKTPVAILYHTQELAFEQPPGSPFSFIDPGARNWLQWIKDGRVANAADYVRKDYPKTAGWAWFVAQELPAFKTHHTIVDKMLDAARVGADTRRSVQWVFTREDCGRSGPAAGDADIQVRLPQGEPVCLSLSRS